MRIDILSTEYPPEIYGGAGVHVAELTRALRRRDDVDVRVRAFGGDRDEAGTWSYAEDARLRAANAALATMGVDLAMAADVVASPDGAPAADYDEATMSAYMKNAEIDISVDVGSGRASATVWTCDLTKGYIEINGDYRS